MNYHATGSLSAVQNKLCRLYYDTEYTNLRKLPLCRVKQPDALRQVWVIGKETLQGPKNGRGR